MFKITDQAGYTKKKQDEGHTVWLKQTKNDFNTCFPELYIKIKVKYTNLYPIYLMVMYFLNKKIIYIEEYFKILDIDNYGNINYKKKVTFIKRNKTKTYTTKTNFENKNVKFSKKDEDNKLLFKLLEKDTTDFKEEFTKEYFFENVNNFDFKLFNDDFKVL